MVQHNRVEHIVALKLTRPFTEAEVEKLRRGLKSIPGVVSVSVGENYSARSAGFNNGIVVRFSSKEAEAAYQSHPLHVELRDTLIKPLLSAEAGTSIAAIDYPFYEPQCPIDYKGFMLMGGLVGFVLGGLVLGRK